MTNPPFSANTIACSECDRLINLPESVDANHSLFCPRCHHKIQSGHKYPLDYVLALSLTGLLLLVAANSFPFLSFEAKGQGHSINLVHASAELFAQGFPALSVLVLAFIIVLPMLYLSMLVVLTMPIKLNLAWRAPVWFGRILSALLPWAMAEVFLIGVLVALIKMMAMATINFGISFWSYILFSVTFTYISAIVDAHRLWKWLE